MDTEKKLSLLNEELDAESAKYIQESILNWKESVMAQLQEEVERAKADKLEELEEANMRYREELKEEFSDKLTTALSELRESVKADATASVLKNNPELKILEQIKELVAPLLNEEYRDEAYSNTIAQLVEQNEALKRNQEIMEGAEHLGRLLSPYDETTQNFVLSLIKEGSPEEVEEQFYDLMEKLQGVFGEADDDEGDDDEDEAPKGKKDDDEDDDDEEEDDEDDEDDDDDDDDEGIGESYINEGFDGDEDDEPRNLNSLKNVIKMYSQNN